MRILYYLLFLILNSSITFGQNIWTNNDVNILNEKIILPDSNFHFTIKPYTVRDFEKFKQIKQINSKSKFIEKLTNKNLIEIKKDVYKFYINPILHSQYFYDTENKYLFSNNRVGLNIFAKVDNKLYFSSDIFYSAIKLSQNKLNFTDSFGIIPHYGKFFSKNGNNYNFISFTGELTYNPTKKIFFHVGRSKHFFGNGYRSLFLSDNSNAYFYLKTTVDIWKIKYVWMAANLNDFELYNSYQNFNLYKKAAFIHYFSLNLTKRVNVNFFETIITNPYDQDGNKTGYEAAYFNPVIFFRPIEFYSGTSDNSLLGIGINIKLFKSLYLYSQFILDDLIISKLNDGSGWWGNKFGVQSGFKNYNFLNVEGLFLRGEINIVRPYTYSHGVTNSEGIISNLNYGNYHQNLAHPSGANFAEAIANICYNREPYMLSAKAILLKQGIDTDSISYGGDIYNDYNLRPNSSGVTFLQGGVTNSIFVDINLSYLINPDYNLRFELGAYYKRSSYIITNKKSIVFYFGLSSKIFNEKQDF